MAVEIVYETHATTTDNEAGIATGRLPGRLSDLGCRQARELGERRPGDGFAAVFASDLHRAVQTARTAFPDGRPPIHQDIRLRECNYGDLNGHPISLIAAQRAQHIDETISRRPELPPGRHGHPCLPPRPHHRMERQQNPGDRPLGQPMGIRPSAHRNTAGRTAASTAYLAPGKLALHAIRRLARLSPVNLCDQSTSP
jgi:hypothetical protein